MNKTKRAFTSAKRLEELIAQYFDQTDPQQNAEDVEKNREPDPPTLAGLAFFLGFNSRREFEACEDKGRYAAMLQRARLRIEAAYEKKLHSHSSGGAVFALKNMERHERPDNNPSGDGSDNVVKVEVVQSGPKLASSEKEVIL